MIAGERLSHETRLLSIHEVNLRYFTFNSPSLCASMDMFWVMFNDVNSYCDWNQYFISVSHGEEIII